jgi:uncharacterized protein YbjT (DUF2867 family)
MNILITGAGGKTGKSIIQLLSGKNHNLSVYLHRQETINEIRKLADVTAFVGDLSDYDLIKQSLVGIDAVYLIIPNMNPFESLIGENIVNLCKQMGVSRIIYHSVLHPQALAMPHHRQKLLVEEKLFESGLDYSILQPSAYMQNILGYLTSIRAGSYPMPYPVSTLLSLVDLNDVAEVASNVITQTGHSFATYELVGSPPLSQSDIAEALTKHTNRIVKPEEVLLTEWLASDPVKAMPEYTRTTLLAMFTYYANYGLVGNTSILSHLLNRNPSSLEEFLKRDYII